MPEQIKNSTHSAETQPNDIDKEIAAAELQKLKLEIKNLEAERRWLSHVGRLIVPMMTAMVSVLGFWWGIHVFSSQQEKDRLTREAERVTLQRNQYRAGYEQLLQFSSNPNMTVAQALSLQKELNSLIDSIYDLNSTDDEAEKEKLKRDGEAEKAKVTDGILALVYNDCDFTQTRNVQLDKAALRDWVGYKENLKGGIVLDRYLQALKDLQSKDPSYMPSIRGTERGDDQDPEPLKDPYRSVIDGFICHYNLLSDNEKTAARLRFGRITKNPYLAADLSSFKCQ